MYDLPPATLHFSGFLRFVVLSDMVSVSRFGRVFLSFLSLHFVGYTLDRTNLAVL